MSDGAGPQLDDPSVASVSPGSITRDGAPTDIGQTSLFGNPGVRVRDSTM